jgi:hypothetical protein
MMLVVMWDDGAVDGQRAVDMVVDKVSRSGGWWVGGGWWVVGGGWWVMISDDDSNAFAHPITSH